MTTITREHLELAAKAAGYVDIDEPAFPRDHQHDGHNGMTLRDYLAAKASEEDIRNVIGGCDYWNLANLLGVSHESVRDDLCGAMFRARVKARYIWADAMLAERAKP